MIVNPYPYNWWTTRNTKLYENKSFRRVETLSMRVTGVKCLPLWHSVSPIH